MSCGAEAATAESMGPPPAVRRRMGWLDLVATRYGCRVQGATSIAFTVLDALGYLDEIPVCVGYELDGKRIDSFPSTYKA